MNTSLHTLGWTDPSTLDPEGGVQLFAVGWLGVVAAAIGVAPMGSPQMANPSILRDDDETTFAVILAFMELREWH